MSFYRENANIFYIYFQVIKKYKDYMEKSLQEFQLTPAEIDVLTFLINNMDKDVTATEISLHRGISKGLVSRAVNMLLNRNIIEVKENPDDARSVYLKILKEEDNLILKVKEKNEIFKSQLIKDIDMTDFDLFLKLNNKILENIKNIEIE